MSILYRTNLGSGIARSRLYPGIIKSPIYIRTLFTSIGPREDSHANHPILKRIPKILRPFAQRFVNAPISHVTAFVILHEFTAIVPLVGFWYVLHKYDLTIPVDLPTWAIDKGTKIIDNAMEKFDFTTFTTHEKAKFILEGAYSYFLVKTLFPVRIILSLGLMPGFAKYFVLPFTKIFTKKKPPGQVTNPIESSIDEANLKKVKKPRL